MSHHNMIRAIKDNQERIEFLEERVKKLKHAGLMTISPPTYAVFDPSDIHGQHKALFDYAKIKHKCDKPDLAATYSTFDPNTISCRSCKWKASMRNESSFEMKRRQHQEYVLSGAYPEYETMIVQNTEHVKSMFPRGAFRIPDIYDEEDNYYCNELVCLVCNDPYEDDSNHKKCVYANRQYGSNCRVSGQKIIGPGVPLPKPLPKNRLATEGEVRFIMGEINRLKGNNTQIDAQISYENSAEFKEKNRKLQKWVENEALEAHYRENEEHTIHQAYLDDHSSGNRSYAQFKVDYKKKYGF